MIRKASTTDKIIRNALVIVLWFSVAFFGGVHVWASTCVQLSLICLLFVFVLVRIPAWWSSKTGDVSWISTPVNLPALLFLALLFLQIISLPEGIVGFFSPYTVSVLKKSEGIITGPVSGCHFTFYRYATLNSLTMGLACLFFYFMLLNSVKQRSELRSVIKAVLLLGFILCMYGLFEKLSGHNHILWWRQKSPGYRVFGTFINPDHFAFFLNMILLLFFGHLYSLMATKRKSEFRKSKSLFASFLENESGIQQMVLLSFCFGIMLVTLIMTGSRAAIFSLALSMTGVFFLLFVKTRRKGLLFLIGFLCVMVLVFGQRIGIEKTIGRFGALSKEVIFEQGRMLYNRSVVPIIKEYPVFGTGLGTFEYVYPRYQPAQEQRYLKELHNDWLQLMVETGIVGFLIVFVGFLAIMKRFITVWWKRHDTFAVGIGIGCIGAIFASAIHSLFDFSLHIPANLLTLTAVVAIGFLALHSKGRYSRKAFSYRVRTIQLWGGGSREQGAGSKGQGAGSRERRGESEKVGR